MARISRKINQKSMECQNEKRLQTAFYLRLSDSDRLLGVSESITNQKNLLMSYIKDKPEFRLVSTYVDDGVTGTNFKRPGFEAMMDAVKQKKINCIIVKDMSRFGRNFLETGNYIENVFPFLNVRFIAVTDGFDSLNSTSSEMAFLMPLKNMMNENYARDISVKERTAKKALRKRGCFLGAHAIYGYVKSEQNKHKLLVDQEAADVVRLIFDMGEQGYSDNAIARHLNAKQILSPAKYKYEKGILHSEKYAKAIGWYPQTVAMILNSRTYVGDMVQGGYCSEEMKGKRKVIPREQWDIVPDCHEAIISAEQFERVARLRENRHQQYLENCTADVSRTENLFIGKLFCADCQKALDRRYVASCSDKYRFVCGVHERSGVCSKKYVLESELVAAVSAVVKSRIDLVSDINQWLLRNRKSQWRKLEDMSRMLIEEQAEIDKLKKTKSHLHGDLSSGLLDKSEYQFMKESYTKRIVAKEDNIKRLEQERKEYIERCTSDNPAISSVLGLSSDRILSRETVEILVDRVEVYEYNRIRVYLNFEDEIRKIVDFLKRTETKADNHIA